MIMISNIISPVTETEFHFCRVYLREEVAVVLILSWYFTVQGLQSLWGFKDRWPFFPFKKVHTLFKFEKYWSNGERKRQTGMLRAEVWNYVSALCLSFFICKERAVI